MKVSADETHISDSELILYKELLNTKSIRIGKFDKTLCQISVGLPCLFCRQICLQICLNIKAKITVNPKNMYFICGYRRQIG